MRTENINQPVELRREEIKIERVPGQGAQVSGKAFTSEDIYIPLRREEPVIQKDAQVREQVRVHKTASTDRQQVSEQVCKEDVEIEDRRILRIRKVKFDRKTREFRVAGKARKQVVVKTGRKDKDVFMVMLNAYAKEVRERPRVGDPERGDEADEGEDDG